MPPHAQHAVVILMNPTTGVALPYPNSTSTVFKGYKSIRPAW
jgi:hypothetical protein